MQRSEKAYSRYSCTTDHQRLYSHRELAADPAPAVYVRRARATIVSGKKAMQQSPVTIVITLKMPLPDDAILRQRGHYAGIAADEDAKTSA